MPVRDPGLPRLIDGLIAGLGFAVLVEAIGPAAWWPALLGLPVGLRVWMRGLAADRRRGPDRLMLTAEGRWLLRCRGAAPRPAELRAGWLAGHYCGLLLLADDGRHWRIYLSASCSSPDGWRRLRVRLRLPQPPGLT